MSCPIHALLNPTESPSNATPRSTPSSLAWPIPQPSQTGATVPSFVPSWGSYYYTAPFTTFLPPMPSSFMEASPGATYEVQSPTSPRRSSSALLSGQIMQDLRATMTPLASATPPHSPPATAQLAMHVGLQAEQLTLLREYAWNAVRFLYAMFRRYLPAPPAGIEELATSDDTVAGKTDTLVWDVLTAMMPGEMEEGARDIGVQDVRTASNLGYTGDRHGRCCEMME